MSKQPDFSIEYHGSICLLYPHSEAGYAWVAEHLPSDAQRWGDGFVVEPRYLDPILAGIRRDGLEVDRVR